MATLLARGFDDVLTERLVALSEAFLAEQTAIDPAVAFVADRNLLGGPSADVLKSAPWMVWGVEQVLESQSGLGTHQRQETYTIVCDLYVANAADLDDPDDSAKAVARLSYLKEQAKEVLFRRANESFGFPRGTIGKKRNYSFRQYAPPTENAEEWIIGGRVTLDVDASYTPEDVAGVPIEEIKVDTGKWSGLYLYGD